MTSSIRQDAWTIKEDELLAEIVLDHIRKGSTQLKAFEEVSKKLSRTAAACGFRWNSSIRKLKHTEIEEAKLARKQRKQTLMTKGFSSTATNENFNSLLNNVQTNETIAFNKVINYLQQLYEQTNEQQINKQSSLHVEQLEQLNYEIERLQTENNLLSKQLQTLTATYEHLSEIINQAYEIIDEQTCR